MRREKSGPLSWTWKGITSENENAWTDGTNIYGNGDDEHGVGGWENFLTLHWMGSAL